MLGVACNTCYIWDAFTGIELSRLKGHSEIARAMFSPCGKYIASTAWDHTVQLWRTSDGSCITVLSDHEGRVTHVVFSSDGETLSSADFGGRVIIRRIRDIIPPIHTQDRTPLITPSLPPVVDPTQHPSPLLDGCTCISPDEETDPEKLRRTPECEEVGEPEERGFNGGAASSGRLEPQQSTAGTSVKRGSSLVDSMTTKFEPVAAGGGVSMSSARLSPVTPVEREALGAQRQPPAHEAQENVSGTVPMQGPTTAGWEYEKRIEGDVVDSGRLGLRQPIANASIRRDEVFGDEAAEGNSPTAYDANLEARSSSEACGAAVEDLSTHAVWPSLLTPTERDAVSRGCPPTREVQNGVNSAARGQVRTRATLTFELAENADASTASATMLPGKWTKTKRHDPPSRSPSPSPSKRSRMA